MKFNKSWFVYFAAASVNLMSMVSGVGYAWSSPCISKLHGDSGPQNNPLKRPTTVWEDSWIASLHNLGATLCPLFIGLVADKYGRKITLIVFSLPALASNIILIFASQASHFYIARFLVGVSTGCVFSVVPLYVAEISSAKDRGSTSLMLSVAITFEQLVVYIIGPYITIRLLAVVSIIPTLMFLVIFGFFVPESPYYLISLNEDEKAIDSLMRLRQVTKSYAEKEVLDVKHNIETSNSGASLKEALKSKVVVKSLLISIGLMVFQQFSGILAILSYLQTIFKAANTSLSEDISVMIVGTVQFIATVLTSKIVDQLGRKTLLIASNMGVFLSLISLGTYFYLQTNGFDVSELFWLPIASIMFYIVSFNMGMGPVVWTIAGEIFPSNLKTHLNGVATFVNIMCAFLISLVFPNVSLFLGMAWSIWIFSIFTIFAIAFVVFVVPETKDRTFLEIQCMLRDGKIK